MDATVAAEDVDARVAAVLVRFRVERFPFIMATGYLHFQHQIALQPRKHGAQEFRGYCDHFSVAMLTTMVLGSPIAPSLTPHGNRSALPPDALLVIRAQPKQAT